MLQSIKQISGVGIQNLFGLRYLACWRLTVTDITLVARLQKGSVCENSLPMSAFVSFQWLQVFTSNI